MPLRRFRLKSYGQLLLALIAVTLLQPLLAQHRLLQILALLILLDGIYVAMPKEMGLKFRRAINTLWVLAAAFAIAARLSDQGVLRDSADIVAAFFQTALYALCLGATLVYILRERNVTLDLIYAAVAGYFFIISTFIGIYTIATTIDPSSIQFQQWITASDSRADIRSQLTYFSFVTAASLGYGDIIPRNPYVQMFAAIEVVAGQFYLATVIARLVSIYGSTPVTTVKVEDPVSSSPAERPAP